MATRRFFVAIAAALKANAAPDPLVMAVADVLQAENPRFDRARFYVAAMTPTPEPKRPTKENR